MADLITAYSTRVCFSGGENRRILDTFKDFDVKHIMLSYHYIDRTFKDAEDLERYLQGYTTVIIDSGTIFGNLRTEEDRTLFLNKYYGFIESLDKQSYTAVVAEKGLHLDKLIPDEALIYPFEDLKETFGRDFRSMCKHIKYIGVPAAKMKGAKDTELDRLFIEARKEGTYIHAFATSSRRVLSLHPFYSANTSSWRSGSRYLNTYIYEGQGRSLRIYQPTDKKDITKTEGELSRIRTRQKLIIQKRQPELAEQIDFAQVLDGDSWEVDKANLTQWILYQEEMGLQPQGKYYLNDDDRQDIVYRKRQLLGKLRTKTSNEESDTKEERHVEEKKEEETEIVDGEIVETTTPMDQFLEESSSKELDRPIKNYRERLTPVDPRMRELRQCDMCILADRCPKYAEGELCKYGLPPENPTYDHNRLDEIAEENLADLMAITMDRIQQAYLQEKLDGTGLNKDLTNLVKMYGELRALAREAQAGESMEIKARGPGVLDMFRSR